MCSFFEDSRGGEPAKWNGWALPPIRERHSFPTFCLPGKIHCASSLLPFLFFTFSHPSQIIPSASRSHSFFSKDTPLHCYFPDIVENLAKWLSLSCKSLAGEPVPSGSPVQQLRGSPIRHDICSLSTPPPAALKLPSSTVPEEALASVPDRRCFRGYEKTTNSLLPDTSPPISSTPSQPKSFARVRLRLSASKSSGDRPLCPFLTDRSTSLQRPDLKNIPPEIEP